MLGAISQTALCKTTPPGKTLPRVAPGATSTTECGRYGRKMSSKIWTGRIQSSIHRSIKKQTYKRSYFTVKCSQLYGSYFYAILVHVLVLPIVKIITAMLRSILPLSLKNTGKYSTAELHPSSMNLLRSVKDSAHFKT